jgi:hypothetical protein
MKQTKPYTTVRQAQRLAAHRDTLPLRSYLLLGNLYRSSRRLLSQSMSPEPSHLEPKFASL